MKKIIIAISIVLFLGVSVAFSAPTSRFDRTILPETNNTYDLGSSALKWRSIYANLSSGCIESVSGLLTSTGTACGSGGGGGGGSGTWATTTSTVSGQLINYPLNTTDIVTVGSTATTTGKFYFDPNLTIPEAVIRGRVIAGTTTPTFNYHASGALFQANYQGTGAETSLFTAGSAIRSGVSFIRSRGSLESPTAVADGDQLGFLGFKGLSSSGTTNVPLGGLIEGYVDGTVSAGSVPTRVSITTGSNSSDRLERFTVKSTGFTGVGTTSPSTRFSVQGNGLFSGNLKVAGLTATGTVSSEDGMWSISPTGVGVLETLTVRSALDLTLNSNIPINFGNSSSIEASIVWDGTDLQFTVPTITAFSGQVHATSFQGTGAATSTLTNGLDISSGCFAINGTCLSTSGGGASLTGGTAGMLALWSSATALTATTTNPLYVGTINATSTNSNYFAGKVGIGSTTPYQELSVNGDIVSDNLVETINYNLDGGGTVITNTASSTIVWREVHATSSIVGWTLLGDVSGSITIDVKKATYANFPTFSTLLNTSPALSSVIKNQSGTLGTVVNAGDIIQFQVNGTPSSVQKVHLMLKLKRI